MAGTAPRDIGYSKIVSIDFNNESRVILYPNPLRYGGDLIVNNSSGQRLNIQFYTISGQKVADVITSSTHVPASTLFTQRGILLYKIYERNGNLSATGKLLIE
ncbi:MAG: T9SS type A sorting domain-containing protein [Bacteroidota bacterium]